MTTPFPDRIETKALLGPGEVPGRRMCLHLLRELAALPRWKRRILLSSLPPLAVQAIVEEWWWRAHGGQTEPAAAPSGGAWNVWAIVAGRGFGKTRAAAEWIWARARENPSARIALVAETLDEVERVMVVGESGLLECARAHERPVWRSGKRILHFPSGAQAHAFTAERPQKLKGPQHHFAWCDELAKWPTGSRTATARADRTWNNLMLGLRLGEHPRAIVTTTPQSVPLLRRILDSPRCASTHGRTRDNPHLPDNFRTAVEEMFRGTRLEREELDGIFLEDFAGALWTRELIERARGVPTAAAPACAGERKFARIVIGVDPPASTGGDSCGIAVCARDDEGICWVLADLTAHGLSPEAWARRVCDAARLYGAGRIVAEKNQGGDMIASNLRAVDSDLPVRLVHAGASKAARAEPIALRFETRRARLAGRFPELEDQLCALTWTGYHGQGSPDRADAMVWAMTELFDKARAEPRIRRL